MKNDNIYTFEIVAQMLKEYKDLKRKALQLEFEIKNYIPIATDEDIIEHMTFGKPSEDEVNYIHKGQTSDKTSKIAVSYSEKAKSLNIKHKHELESELRYVNVGILRIEYYIGLLEEKHSRVLRMLYVDGLTYVKAAEENKISIAALKKLRITGISKLVEMYNTIIC